MARASGSRMIGVPSVVMETTLELAGGLLQLRLGLLGERGAASDLVEDARCVGTQVLDQLSLEATDVLNWDVIELALAGQPDGDHLVLDGLRCVLGLLQQLDRRSPRSS